MIKRLAKDVAVYGAGDLVFKFAAFAAFPIYANLFSVAQFGVLTLVTTLAGLIGIVLTLGMNNAIQRYYLDPDMLVEQRPVLVSTGLTVLVVWSLLVTVALLTTFYLLRDVVDQRYDIQWPFIALALSANLPSLVITYCLDVLRLHFSPWWFSLLSGLKNLSGVLIGLFLIIALDQGLLGFFMGQALAFALVAPLGLWLIRGDLKWRFDSRLAREVVSFGYPFIFVGIAYWLSGSMDRWMLSEFSDNTEVGLYSIAYKFAGVLTFVTAAFAQAWAPFAIKLYAEDPDYRSKISRIFSYWFFGLAFIGTLVSLFGHEVLRLTTPEPYWPAATILGVLAMSVVLLGTTQFTALGISLSRRSKLLSVAAWANAVVNFGLNLVLIPRLGALGAAVATFVSYTVLTGLYLYWTQKLHSLPIEHKKLLFSLGIVVSVPFLAGLLNSFEWGFWLVVAKMSVACLVLFLGLMTRTVNISDLQGLFRRSPA